MHGPLAALLVATAWAGEASAPAQGILEHIRADPLGLPWYTWAWVGMIALLGWFASSAPTLAGWIDDHNGGSRELWTRRWAIIGRLGACLAAGVAAFLAGMLMGTPMVANLLAVLFAAYGGDKYLQMQADRVASKPPNGGGS